MLVRAIAGAAAAVVAVVALLPVASSNRARNASSLSCPAFSSSFSAA